MPQSGKKSNDNLVRSLFNYENYFFHSRSQPSWKIVEKKAGKHYVFTRDRDILIFRAILTANLEIVISVTLNGYQIHHAGLVQYGLEDIYRQFFLDISDVAFVQRDRKSLRTKERYEELFADGIPKVIEEN